MCPSANRDEDGLKRSSVRYLFLEYLINLGGSSRIFTRPPDITYGKCMVWIGILELMRLLDADFVTWPHGGGSASCAHFNQLQ